SNDTPRYLAGMTEDTPRERARLTIRSRHSHGRATSSGPRIQPEPSHTPNGQESAFRTAGSPPLTGGSRLRLRHRMAGPRSPQVVHDDQSELALCRVEPPGLGPQVEQAEVGGVVNPKGRGLQVVAGSQYPGPVLLRHPALAQPVARDARPAADEPLGQLGLGH